MQYDLKNNSFGFAYTGDFVCLMFAPLTNLALKIFLIWFGSACALILAMIVISKMIGHSSQIFLDALTGLHNRRALMKYCDNHVKYHPEEKLCLIMLDLNGFKSINDKYGHAVGDNALIEAAGALKLACAHAPCAFNLYRYGGDEFMLTGVNCTDEEIEQTKQLIDRQLTLIKHNDDKPYTLSVSIGVAIGAASDDEGLENLLELADKEMYENKIAISVAKQ